MRHKKAEVFLIATAVMATLLCLCLLHGRVQENLRADELAKRSRMVEELMLTDLALFMEARYTRHLSLADRHSAFQDHPMSLEHFPAGSLAGPPPHLTGVER
ncbi:MAG: hypothetical protein KAR83_07605 [Thermodesulfovibrionales bacterium]|nr:hypothetical protein [Thermodesulfovibrionales bacterium]